MSNAKREFLLVKLHELSNAEPMDIESDDFEICGENIKGEDFCIEESIVKTALDALKCIEEQQAKIDKLKDELERTKEAELLNKRLEGLALSEIYGLEKAISKISSSIYSSEIATETEPYSCLIREIEKALAELEENNETTK